MKSMGRVVVMALLASMLSGCFLTKIVTTPMRLVGASASVVGAGLSVFPVVGNQADAGLETVDKAIDEVADNLDKVPI